MRLIAGLIAPLLFISPVAPAAEKKLPADDFAGPPFVTCKTWAMGDGTTGELLWGGEPDLPVKSASTTKIMCALVVLRMAEVDPDVLNETVTFSQFADETDGSTAGVKEGESLTVGECLYGLMLPSGNDAGNALAEHFNDRLAPPGEHATTQPAKDTRTNFVAEMNREAAVIGLKNTVYRTPYGDGGTPDDRTTTARDLLKLASVAMKNETFRKYVGTLRHETDVTTPDGGKRHIVWENTNRLLPIEGYDGVKTGTTTQAGYCVVSSARRDIGNADQDHLILVVLGSTSDDGRYVDSKNLWRWAWQERAKGRRVAR